MKWYLTTVFYLGWPLSLDRGIVSSEYSSRSHLSDWHKTFTFRRIRASQFIDFVKKKKKKKIYLLLLLLRRFFALNLSVECLSYCTQIKRHHVNSRKKNHNKKILGRLKTCGVIFFFTEGWTWRKLRNFSMTAMKIEVNTSNPLVLDYHVKNVTLSSPL